MALTAAPLRTGVHPAWCRYITRAALANERVQSNSTAQVVLKLKTPWRDGTTHLVVSPLEFMQRLAAPEPRPRLHLIRFHGVLKPNAKLRALVVPKGSDKEAGASTCIPGPANRCVRHRTDGVAGTDDHAGAILPVQLLGPTCQSATNTPPR